MSHRLKVKVAEGKSAQSDETTELAEASDMSRMLILHDCDAKNFVMARPMPDAPPG